jgi:hypothetical protein
MIYGYNPPEKRASERAEQKEIAMQDKRSGDFFAAPGFEVTLVKPVLLRDKFFNKLEAYNTETETLCQVQLLLLKLSMQLLVTWFLKSRQLTM